MIIILIFIIIIISVILFFHFFLQIVTISGESMSPTLSDTDRVLAIRYWPASWLKKGQIVVVRSPIRMCLTSPDSEKDVLLIKRVFALAGETVTRDEQGNNLVDQSKRKMIYSLNEEMIWQVPNK